MTICTAELALNLPTTPFLFVLSDIFPAARAIKLPLHATSGFFLESEYCCHSLSDPHAAAFQHALHALLFLRRGSRGVGRWSFVE